MPQNDDSKHVVAVDQLTELLDQQDKKMQELFAKAINLFVAPGAADMTDREKVDRLRKAIDDSLK